jgi:hypothetical protein
MYPTRLALTALLMMLCAAFVGSTLAQTPRVQIYPRPGSPFVIANFVALPPSNPMGLLMRPDVQSEIRLSLKQRRALAALQEEAQMAMRERIAANFQDLRNLPPEERRQRIQERRNALPAQISAFQGELSQKVKEILKEEQIQRLHELDLQYRGPLALADPQVAEGVKLSSESRSEIANIAAEYQQEAQKIVQQALQEWQTVGAPQGAPPPDFQNRLSPIGRKLHEARKKAEEEVVSVLTAEERARWKQAQGRKFTFRSALSLRRGPQISPSSAPFGP